MMLSIRVAAAVFLAAAGGLYFFSNSQIATCPSPAVDSQSSGGGAICRPAPSDPVVRELTALNCDTAAVPANSPNADVVEIDVADVDPELLARANELGQPLDPEFLRMASRLKRIVDSNPNKDVPAIFCYDPDIDPDDMSRLWELVPELSPYARYQFDDNSRWGGASFQGQPATITWSLVPDGLLVDGGVSELFENLDAKFGNRDLWISRVEQSFGRWSELTGITYVRVTAPGVDWDDGASFHTGAGPTRGAVRIGMIFIDGPSGILAYNYFPPNGNMVLDSAESWGAQSANSHRFFRNVLMHEMGHGIGIHHVCPISSSWLMEPFLNTTFDGPQHDDIRAGQRGYGDFYASNGTPATAADLGPVIFGSPRVIGTPPPGNPPAGNISHGSILSIDGDADVDWYRFTVIDESTANVTVTPLGLIYDSSPQSCPGNFGNCCFSNIVNSETVSILRVAFFDSDGNTELDSAVAANFGESVSLNDVLLPNSPGDYYIRVSKTTFGITPQLYKMDLSVVTLGADVSPPQPNPIGFEVPPTPASTTAITMTANLATDASEPIFYQFQFVSGGAGGGPSSNFQLDRTWTDFGLLPNRFYNYRVRTLDSAPHPGPNVGDFSETFLTATLIETPAGVDFGAVTETSVEMMLVAPLPSFYQVEQAGIFFESTTPGGNDGIQEWLQVTFDEAINLTPNTEYDFRAKARNRVAIETVDFSPPNSVVTLAAAPAAPALANPSSISMKINPDAGANPSYTELSILCTATAPFDANWDGQYVDATGAPSATPVWVSDEDWGNLLLTNMQSDTEYTFVVRARNLDGIETADGPPASLTTHVAGFCDLLGDINDDGIVDGLDVAGFTRAILGMPEPSDKVNCADFGNGDVLLDAADFAADLIGG